MKILLKLLMTYQVKRLANESHQKLKLRVQSEAQKLYASEMWIKLWDNMWNEYREKNQRTKKLKSQK